MNPWLRILGAMSIFGASVAAVAVARTASAEPLVTCNILGGGNGDNWALRGFYLTGAPSAAFAVSVELRLDLPFEGEYTLTLTARANSYDGPLLGESELVLAGDGEAPAVFTFETPFVITPGTLVTFTPGRVSGPEGFIFFDTGGYSDDAPSDCPVYETHDLLPPLGEFRRYGIGIVISGEPFAYRLGLPVMASD